MSGQDTGGQDTGGQTTGGRGTEATGAGGRIAAGSAVPHTVRVNPPTIPAPAGHYSHAVRAGDLLFVSGQAALDDEGKVIGEGDVERQSEFIFECLAVILADQGCSFDDVVNIRTFLTDMSQLQQYGGVRRRYMTGEPPSSTTVEVSRLFRPGLLLEVDVVAAVPR